MDRHICCVVDTETTMRNEDHRLVYQIGWCISNLADLEGQDYHSRVFLVEETIENPEHFTWKTKMYSDNGVPLLNYQIDPRYKKIIRQSFKDAKLKNPLVQSWTEIMRIFNADCMNMGVDSITAYNINFDLIFHLPKLTSPGIISLWEPLNTGRVFISVSFLYINALL